MRLALTALTLALLLTTASGQTGAATVEFEDQESDGTHVVVQQVTLSNGGFIVIHDETGAVIGNSEYLTVGTHDDVQVNITIQMGAGNGTDNATGNAVTLVAMAHFDSNGNEEFDFESSNGAEDGAYEDGGVAETDEATVTIQETQGAQPGDDDDFDDPDTDTPAVGVLLMVAMLGALALVRRRS